ncbi:MAG: phosphoribosylamine--glycine ligase [Pyrinomonadaceae bacterium]|nr:phosphoribosylamine--glycine ligase [Pyrinomonadaceae bacterium]
MKLLVLGSGGREHAILWTLNQTSDVALDLYCAPGNAGIAELATCKPILLADHSALIKLVKTEAIDLTIVGPEVPLADGIVDQFERNGLAIVGPNQAAARLESSKAFAKDFMARHKIPTAEYRVVNSAEEAKEILRSGAFGPAASRAVVKADGLAAGKGVVVANSRAEAEESVRMLMSGEMIRAEATRQVVIEEALWGREASLLLFADGRDYAFMPPARDHKRIGENDTGPNTGGMGAVTGASILEAETLQRVVREIVEPTLAGARAEGFAFRGVLFLGLMITADGPKLLEYNVRMGDPETQAILVRLKTSLVDIFEAIRTGRLREVKVEWTNDFSACVVLASEGYPAEYKKDIPIEGLDVGISLGDVTVFHAATKRSETGELVTAGGRVLGVTARAETLERALSKCYKAAAQIRWEGMQYRRDIGKFSELPSKTSSSLG